MPQITLPDGSQRDFDKSVSVMDIANDIGPGLARATLAGKVDGELVDAAYLVDQDAKVAIVTNRDSEALELLRHDAAHVMAQAVQELYPGTQVTIGPAIEDGFYYDFARQEPFTPEDLVEIDVSTNLLDSARHVYSLLKSGEDNLDYNLSGNVKVDLPFIKSLPFSRTGQVNLRGLDAR